MSERYLQATSLLDYDHPTLAQLVQRRGWRQLPEGARIGAIHDFVRDEIAFGYNVDDRLSASQALADGYGQCNTKTILLMALLRASGIACRFHGATIHKRLQRGVVNGLFYWLAPTNIIHTWAEVLFERRWLALEGVILDRTYLDGLRATFPEARADFLGYGAGIENLRNPKNEWRGEHTFIQSTGVSQDFGVFDDPDAFYAHHGGNLSGPKAYLYAHWIRHRMNRNVGRLRACGNQAACLLSATGGTT